VISWLNANFAASAISSVTIFELGAGVALLDPGRRKEALESAASPPQARRSQNGLNVNSRRHGFVCSR
jgi:hypothetical protein